MLSQWRLSEVTGSSSRIFGMDTLRHWRCVGASQGLVVTSISGSPLSRTRARAALPPPEPPTGGVARRIPFIDAVGTAAGGKFGNEV